MSISISGPWSASQTGAFQIIGSGPYQFVLTTGVSASATTSAVATASGVIPAGYTPSVNLSVPWPIISNGVAGWGQCTLDTSGNITWTASASGSAFGSSGTAAIGSGGYIIWYPGSSLAPSTSTPPAAATVESKSDGWMRVKKRG